MRAMAHSETLSPAPALSPLAPPPRLALDRIALFLDFDGTLAEIVPTPDEARLDAALGLTLARLSERLDGRLAILSGRDVKTLARLTGLPGLPMAGVHGLERRRAGGRLQRPAPAGGMEGARMRLNDLVAREPGLLLEDKGLSLALHYRGAPGLASVAHSRARLVAEQFGLALQTGKMVIELRQPGADKGMALNAFMAEPPFAGALPWMLGDDDTDESAFAAAVAAGGGAVRIGPARAGTAATHGLADVPQVARWLEELAR
ncbi:trehalose-phosphatase [Sandaracinobacter sp. RS1-74]|uniref:trehalose-phosphatase n=1 Tax=Sandaracinobacteroides sayramensis TaxID=2913411 RepID=UPI001EDA2DEE|nr:trehalose-phosphatase [Sandaracinobacteroides sayramensis]MCG2842610.1 trehalose-phosphatase [Sandaracinobacteroides sayramensis]